MSPETDQQIEIFSPKERLFNDIQNAHKGTRPNESDESPLMKAIKFMAEMKVKINEQGTVARYEQELSGVQGRTFVFDIEETLMSKIPISEADKQSYGLDKNDWPYFTYMHMSELIQVLKVKNNVVFYTAAPRDSLDSMRKSMASQVATIPIVAWEDIIDAMIAYQSKGAQEAASILEKVVPWINVDAVQNCFGKIDLLNSSSKPIDRQDPLLVHYLQNHKFPELFAKPTKDFFIDNANLMIETVVERGWSGERALCATDFYKPESVDDLIGKITQTTTHTK